mmetsp:Transcript_119720/g.211634  ORF Transcript_119720/g.211634 Transcript_119720/m.211634 type:complete len:415 (-) Transcript_119720:48-1292(-)
MAPNLAADVDGAPRTSRRLALILSNGAYTYKKPLSRPAGTAAELSRKLVAMGFEVVSGIDQDLAAMRATTFRWLRLVEAAAEAEATGTVVSNVAKASASASLMLFFVFCGHGGAGRFFPVDCPAKGAAPEETYCFFEDFLFRLYDALSCNVLLRQGPARERSGEPPWEWRRGLSIQIVAVIESCRRLSAVEQKAYEQQRARIASGRRHLLPCVANTRADLAHMGGAEWDAARLSFLARLGPESPQLQLALSSESTTPSYDVVFLRSITEQIDRPVRLSGILERASLDTLRRTGYKQKPVLLSLSDRTSSLQDVILAPAPTGPADGADPALQRRRRSSSASGLKADSCFATSRTSSGNASIHARQASSPPGRLAVAGVMTSALMPCSIEPEGSHRSHKLTPGRPARLFASLPSLA